jgi:REP element-mobilizing transposase RayT
MAQQQNRDREEAATNQNRDREGAANDRPATTYLITWVCYGAWLPGQNGIVDGTHNRFGARFPEPNAAQELQSRNCMAQEPYLLDLARRQIVLKSLEEVCSHRRWALLAAHVRTNHVHVVTAANCRPEQVMSTMKAYSSRALNAYALDIPDRLRWPRPGSTRYLWTGDSVRAAIQYVVREQGELMAALETPSPR